MCCLQEQACRDLNKQRNIRSERERAKVALVPHLLVCLLWSDSLEARGRVHANEGGKSYFVVGLRRLVGADGALSM